MDIGAYAQIDNLGKVAEANDIYIPRLRGYRLMSEETEIDVEKAILDNNTEVECCKDLIEQSWTRSGWFSFSSETEARCNRYMVKNPNYGVNGAEDEWREYKSVRWDRLHGKHKRMLKLDIKTKNKRIRNQFNTFNKYVGRDDVMMIHARIGGYNWAYYGGAELGQQPWFIEKVDDAYDSTYCDIYVRIDPNTVKCSKNDNLAEDEPISADE